MEERRNTLQELVRREAVGYTQAEAEGFPGTVGFEPFCRDWPPHVFKAYPIFDRKPARTRSPNPQTDRLVAFVGWYTDTDEVGAPWFALGRFRNRQSGETFELGVTEVELRRFNGGDHILLGPTALGPVPDPGEPISFALIDDPLHAGPIATDVPMFGQPAGLATSDAADSSASTLTFRGGQADHRTSGAAGAFSARAAKMTAYKAKLRSGTGQQRGMFGQPLAVFAGPSRQGTTGSSRRLRPSPSSGPMEDDVPPPAAVFSDRRRKLTGLPSSPPKAKKVKIEHESDDDMILDFD